MHFALWDKICDGGKMELMSFSACIVHLTGRVSWKELTDCMILGVPLNCSGKRELIIGPISQAVVRTKLGNAWGKDLQIIV